MTPAVLLRCWTSLCDGCFQTDLHCSRRDLNRKHCRNARETSANKFTRFMAMLKIINAAMKDCSNANTANAISIHPKREAVLGSLCPLDGVFFSDHLEIT